MSKRNVIFLLVAAALLLSAGIFAFFRLERAKTAVGDPLDGIPPGAFCIIRSHDIRATWQKLNEGNLAWDAFGETQWAAAVDSIASLADSLLGASPSTEKIFSGNASWLSLHCTGNDRFDFVLATSFSSVTDDDEFISFVKKNAGAKVSETKWKEHTLLTFGKVFVGIHDGVVLLSQNETLLKTGLDQLVKGGSLKQDNNFMRVASTAGEKTDGNVYVNYKNLVVALKRIANDNFTDRLDDLSRFGEWTELDLSLRSNALLMNGYTAAPDSINDFLDVLRGQEPQHIAADAVLPASTVTYADFCISNFDLFLKNYDNYLAKDNRAADRRDHLARLKTDFGFDPSQHIGAWFGNEIVAAQIVLPSGETSTFALIGTAGTAQAVRTLRNFELRNDTAMQVAAMDSTGYSIYHNAVPEMLPAVFGNMFSDLGESYYTVVGQYIVFANSENALRGFIVQVEDGHTLLHNKNYADFSTNLSKQSGLTLFAAPAGCGGLLKDRASVGFAADLHNHLPLLWRFDGFALQFSGSDNDLFYTDLFLRHNPQTKKDVSSLWETALDTTFSGKPWLVKNHKTNGLDIFLQDDANKIYLISSTGKILWKRKLDEKISGEVQQVDALKNGKLQLIFSTPSALYVVDRNGNDVDGFPVKFPARASNAISVIDYDNNRDYRIFIACTDKKVYNYDIKGKKVDGWKFSGTNALVTTAVKVITLSGKDYVIIVDVSGKIYITDRQGSTRLSLNEKLNENAVQVFSEKGNDPAHTYLVTSDSLGNVTRLSLTDDLVRLHFTDFQDPPSFTYFDINGDGAGDFIFTDANRLLAFNKDKNTVMSHSFDVPASGNPIPFDFGTHDVRLGVVCGSELFLVNGSGTVADGFPLRGNTPFAIGRLNGNDGYTVLCGNNKKYIVAYPMK